MGNKWSKITKKLWLANTSAGLAIASLFSIGFSAWAEVGSAVSTTIDGINISVSNHGANVVAFDSESFYLYNTGIMQNQDDLVYTSSPYLSFLAVFEIKQVDVNRSINCTFDLSCPNGFEPGTTSYKSSTGDVEVAYKCKTKFYSTSTAEPTTTIDALNTESFQNMNFDYPPKESNTYTFINSTPLSTNAYLHVYLEWNIVPPSDYVAFYTAVNGLSSLKFTLNIQTEVI